MDKEFDALNELNFDSYRDPVELFDRIWEKANEKAWKEYPDDPEKMHDSLQKHILEMLTLVEYPVPEVENHISNIENNPAATTSILDTIFMVLACSVMVAGIIMIGCMTAGAISHLH